MSSIDINNYKKLERIGSGSFGVVLKVKNKTTKEIYAAKISSFLNKDEEKEFQKNLTREVSILCKIHHPSILKFIGLSLNDFDDLDRPVIITDYLPNGSLDDILDKSHKGCAPKEWNDTIKLINIYGIAVAMSFLHKNNIIHRDLKPANILLNEYLFPILADFGLSKELSLENSTMNIKGTPLYIAPEIWEDNDYTEKCDVYAYSYLLYEIYANKKPFKGVGQFQLPKKICKGERPDVSKIKKPYRDLIVRCWQNEPIKRPSFDEIVNELKTNKGFITDDVEEEDFKSYVKYIRKSPKSFDNYVKIDPFNPEKTKIIKKMLLKKEMLLSIDDYDKLTKSCQKLVTKAKEDSDCQYEVGQNLIYEKNGFSQNIEIGIKYIKQAIKGGSIDAVILYNRLLITGKIIEKNIKKAKENLAKYDDLNNPKIIFLQAMIEKKGENFPKAIRLLKKSIKLKNGEAMFEYGKMLYLGDGCDRNKREAKKYFKQAKENGCKKSDKFLARQEEEEEEDEKVLKKSKKSKSKYDKKIDLVILIDGQITNKNFFDVLTESFDAIASNCASKFPKILFRFGVVIYRDLIVSQKIQTKTLKQPLVLDLTNDFDEVQSFLNNYLPAGGSVKLATDWACGYFALNENISWDESSEKVVVQIGNIPAHGKLYTIKQNWHKKYFNIPKFRRNLDFNENFEKYKEMQNKQNGWLSYQIVQLAEKNVKFYCLNGNEVSLFCFDKVSSKFIEKGGKKFVIKDVFGFTFDNSKPHKSDDSSNSDDDDDDGDDGDLRHLKKEICDFFSNVVRSCANADDDEDDNLNEFESECKKEFRRDLKKFLSENEDEDNDRNRHQPKRREDGRRPPSSPNRKDATRPKKK